MQGSICPEKEKLNYIELYLFLKTLFDYSEKRNSKELHKHLMRPLDEEKPNFKVHKDCRRDITN